MTERQDLAQRKADLQAKLEALDYRYDAEYLESIDALKYYNDDERDDLT